MIGELSEGQCDSWVVTHLLLLLLQAKLLLLAELLLLLKSQRPQRPLRSL
jgi:hypothetical protein